MRIVTGDASRTETHTVWLSFRVSDGSDEFPVVTSVTTGATVSTITRVLLYGGACTFPAASLTRTSNTCKPCDRPLYAVRSLHDPLFRRVTTDTADSSSRPQTCTDTSLTFTHMGSCVVNPDCGASRSTVIT
jgi:hypothetical protein